DEDGLELDRRAPLGPLGWLFCLLLVAATAAILDFGVLPPSVKVKDVAQADIAARVDFSYMDVEWLSKARQQKAEETPPVYRQLPNWIQGILSDLRVLCDNSENAGSADEAVALSGDPRYRTLVQELYKYNKERSAQTLSTILLPHIELVLKGIARSGVLSDDAYREVFRKKGDRQIIRIDPAAPKVKQEVPIERLLSLTKARNNLDLGLQAKGLPDGLQRALMRHLLEKMGENLELDPESTRREMELARASVPDVPREIQKGTVILSKGAMATPETVLMLREEARAYKAQMSWEQDALRWSGLSVLAAAVLYFFLLSLRRLKVDLLRRRPLVMLAFTSLSVLAASKALMIYELPAQCAPVAFAAVAASLAFSQGVALVTAITLSVLVGFAAGGNLGLTLGLMLGASLMALPARKLQHRLDLLRYGVYGGLAQGAVAAGFALLRSGEQMASGPAALLVSSLLPVLSDAAWSFFSCLGCGLILLGALPLIEAAFGIITNIRLFELCDQNQPALRKIMLEAPGTWAHTLQVAFLSEPAAEAVGANARLVRAGVYYHDLGKTLKPEYFVENQLGAEERHRRLAPSVSALIITAHVKDGIELAHEFGLPQQIVDFIPEHHGTTLVSYFYHSARKKAETDRPGGASAVQEAFYRYPGPKPQSRETAIVMLADTIEAATRTLEGPSAARLRAFIHDLIMHKLLDGQLDESDLTFRDLAVIEDVFLRVLVSRFHGRIRYPGQDEPAKNEGEAQPATPQGGVPAVAPTTAVLPVAPGDQSAIATQRLPDTKMWRRAQTSIPASAGGETGAAPTEKPPSNG
ncbi:MAG: HDIG domain-containing protein, partial [Planctomycetota bacterium]|nr:HDIG domain-containing protein [Planctomycetota bacterium]